mmetsp:Transcript_16171/g.50683  ORF Transcript_16171/g.50683 Transcript_16171/m.50683 type:complete len:252 (-) Transcript_16171:21-776(-)
MSGEDDALEREMEAEALTAIFMEDLEIENEVCYRVQLEPEASGTVHVSVRLVAVVDETYPSSSRPTLSIESSKGLSKALVDEVLSVASSAAAECEGSVCIFETASAVKSWLTEHNEPGLSDDSMYANMLRRETEQREAERREAAPVDDQTEAERRRRLDDGTPCTPETFEAWRTRFHAELVVESPQPSDTAPHKLTGKQLFQRGTAAEVKPEDDGDIPQHTPLDDSLFQDADLDDIDFEDDDDDDEDDDDD